MTECLYILMRTDLESLNAGKAMAQAAHAANDFVAYFDGLDVITKWKEQAETFGTTIVLDGGTGDNIIKIIDSIHRNGEYASWIYDPEYPVSDGKVIHLIPNFLTCAWVYTDNMGSIPELNKLSLHA